MSDEGQEVSNAEFTYSVSDSNGLTSVSTSFEIIVRFHILFYFKVSLTARPSTANR